MFSFLCDTVVLFVAVVVLLKLWTGDSVVCTNPIVPSALSGDTFVVFSDTLRGFDVVLTKLCTVLFLCSIVSFVPEELAANGVVVTFMLMPIPVMFSGALVVVLAMGIDGMLFVLFCTLFELTVEFTEVISLTSVVTTDD